MITDIEIAQSIKPKKITEIAKSANISEDYLELYGNYKAKVDLKIMDSINKPNGKLILVTAITPTPAGEGKTTTTIGLADGLSKIGKNVAQRALVTDINIVKRRAFAGDFLDAVEHLRGTVGEIICQHNIDACVQAGDRRMRANESDAAGQ